jgi:SAM-dependent methyltransferase
MFRALAPWSREVARTELLDQPGTPAAELAESLADIARLNRLGPTRALLDQLAPFFDRQPADEPLRVLDLGTGSADIPIAVVRWAQAHGRRVSVVAVDLQPSVLACARRAVSEMPEIRLVAGDAVCPPVRPGGVDVALCSLTLHHLSEGGVVALFRLMADVARRGFVVSDLRRSRLGYAAAWLATRAISRNRLTRHDGPLSVRRAYTREELVRLSEAAGLGHVSWRDAPWFRVLGVYAKR